MENDDARIKEYIAVKVIENAVLVRVRDQWISFAQWEGSGGASEYLGHRIEKLKTVRQAAQR